MTNARGTTNGKRPVRSASLNDRARDIANELKDSGIPLNYLHNAARWLMETRQTPRYEAVRNEARRQWIVNSRALARTLRRLGNESEAREVEREAGL